MGYFKHVRSNVKGGVDVELGEKSIIVGPNGSGKSAVQNSLELATRGFVTDLTGRDEVKRESDLFSLGDGDTLESVAVMDDGTEFKWSTVKKGKSVKSADFSAPTSVAWPVLEVESMLKGNAETQRKWLLRVAGETSRATIHSYITDTDIYDRIAKRFEPMEEAELLAKVLEVVSSDARKSKSRMTQAETVAEALSRGLGAEPRDSELDDLQARLNELRSSAPMPGAVHVSQADVDSAATRANAAVNHWTAARSALEDAQDARAKIQVPATRDLIVQMGKTLRHIEPHNPSACLVCGTEVQRDWSALADQWEAQANQYAEIDQMDREISRLATMEESRRRVATNLVDNYKAISEKFASQPPAPDNSLLGEIAAAQKALSEAAFVKNEWKKVRDQQSIVKEARVEHRDLSNLKDDCRSAMDALVKNSVTAFEQAVQAHLPDSDDFRLVLGDKSVSMGFVRDGVLHTALSGAEWARLTLAVASAQLRLAQHSGPVVVTPKERAWDPDTLAASMRALSDAPGQVLLLSPIRPKGRLPKGWTLVEVG